MTHKEFIKKHEHIIKSLNVNKYAADDKISSVDFVISRYASNDELESFLSDREKVRGCYINVTIPPKENIFNN